jgi:CSLREA domain-containing protein
VEALEAREVPATLIYSDTYSWTGSAGNATVALTVTEDAPGFEGLYRWEYQLTNNTFSAPPMGDGIGIFSVDVGDAADISNVGGSPGWLGVVEEQGATDEVWWRGEPLGTSGTAEFSFTTPATAVVLMSGFASDLRLVSQAVGPVAAPAPALVVNTHLDNDNGDTETSLREAINTVNSPQNRAGIWRITFAPGLEMITLDPTRGELRLQKNVYIDGPEDGWIFIQRNSTSTVKHRLFNIDAGVTAKLEGLNLSWGEVEGPGGAVQSYGNLTVEDCTFEWNKAAGSRGGAIAALGVGKSLTITECDFERNEAARGGAIYIGERVSTTITNSEIGDGYATVVGGGIYIDASTTADPTAVTLAGVSIYNNSSEQQGGGIYVGGSSGAGTTLSLVATDVYLNTSLSNNPDYGKGGGLYFLRGTLILSGSSFANNTALAGPQAYRNQTGTAVIYLAPPSDYEEVVGPP